MFVYSLNAILWNIVHDNMLKNFNMDIIKKAFTKVKAYAVRTGLEPVTPCVTGMYSNQLN